MNDNYSKEQYEIMRTAFLTAFPKIFTNIEYATEIFQVLLKLAPTYGFQFTPEQFTAKMAPEIEARYKAASATLQEALREYNDATVLEIASGLSPRALELRNHTYHEIDFPAIMELKTDVWKTLEFEIHEKEFVGIDLADGPKLNKFLNEQAQANTETPIVFLSEGLFWYLSRKEIATLTDKIYNVLKGNGGCWITTDCPVDEAFRPKIQKTYRSIVAKSSHRENKKPFQSLSEFSEFFENKGFEVEHFKILDKINTAKITSAKLFGYSESEIVEKMNSYTNIAIFRIKE